MTPAAERTRITLVDGAAIAVGDVIVFLGRPRLVDRITPASDRTKALVDDPNARTAHAGDDWRMTIHRGQRLETIALEGAQ